MDSKKKKQVTFRIADIINRNFSISDFPLKKTKKINDQVKFELKFKVTPDIKKNIIDFGYELVITHIATNKKVSNVETSFIFEVQDLEKFANESSFTDDILPVTIASISFSTFRGIVYEKFKGTKLADLPPLPLIDPKAMIGIANNNEKK